jgi:hypothetical protein
VHIPLIPFCPRILVMKREKPRQVSTSGPEWERAVSEVEALESRFHNLWREWERRLEQRRMEEALRQRRAFLRSRPDILEREEGVLPRKKDFILVESERRRAEHRDRHHPAHHHHHHHHREDERTERTTPGRSPREREQHQWDGGASHKPLERDDSSDDDDGSGAEVRHLKGRQRTDGQKGKEEMGGRLAEGRLERSRKEQRVEEEEEAEGLRAGWARASAEEEEEEEEEKEEEEVAAVPLTAHKAGPRPSASSGPFRHHCAMCGVTLNSKKQMGEHYGGKKHLLAMQQQPQPQQHPIPPRPVGPPTGPSRQQWSQPPPMKWQTQRDWRGDDEMNWEREKARGWSKQVKSEPPDSDGAEPSSSSSTTTTTTSCSLHRPDEQRRPMPTVPATNVGSLAPPEAQAVKTEVVATTTTGGTTEAGGSLELDLNAGGLEPTNAAVAAAATLGHATAPAHQPAARPGRKTRVVNLFGVQMVIEDEEEEEEEDLAEAEQGEDDERDNSHGEGEEEDDDEESDDESDIEGSEEDSDEVDVEKDMDSYSDDSTEAYISSGGSDGEEHSSDEDDEVYAESEGEEEEGGKEGMEGKKAAAIGLDPNGLVLERAKEERRKLLAALKETRRGRRTIKLEEKEKEEEGEGGYVHRRGGGKEEAEEKGGPKKEEETRPRRGLCSPEERRERWEIKHALARSYVEEHEGRLPTKSEDLMLWNWILYARRTWHKLDADQLAKLQALGVRPIKRRTKRRGDGRRRAGAQEREEVDEVDERWTTSATTTRPTKARPKRLIDSALWQSLLEDLKYYRRLRGHNPPYSHPAGQWLYEQIALQSRGLLDRARKKKLEALGVKWDWQEDVDQHDRQPLREGDGQVKEDAGPTKERVAKEAVEGSGGGEPRSERRGHERKKGKKEEEEKTKEEKKTKERKKTAATTTTTPTMATKRKKRIMWDQRFAELVQFCAAHGKGQPFQGALAKWLTFQRWAANTGKLSEAKIEQLRSMGIALPPRKQTTTSPATTTTMVMKPSGGSK